MSAKIIKRTLLGLIVIGALVFVFKPSRSPGASGPARLTANEAAEDAEEFFSTMKRVHPDIAANIGPEGYLRLKQLTNEGIKAGLDKDKTITVGALAYLLYYAAAAVGDAHTDVTWYDIGEWGKKQCVFPPFWISYRNGKFLLDAAADSGIEGMELSVVNGIPFRDFIRPILDRISGETFNWRAIKFTRDQKFWWEFSGLLKGSGKLKLSLIDTSGQAIEREVETVSARGFKWPNLKHIWKDHDRIIGKLGPNSRLKILDKEKIAWLDYRSFVSTEKEEKKLAGIFGRIKDSGVSDLVIDIRGNGGGYSPIGEFMLSYLTEVGTSLSSGVQAKISEDRLRLMPDDPELTAKKGKTVFFPSDGKKLKKADSYFKGKVRLLIDNGTFSTASDFACAFRDYGVGEIIGYESGGQPASFGEGLFFQLKNSSITYRVSSNKSFNPKPRPGDDKHGVIPDVLLNDELLRPYGGSVQAFVVDRILRERKSPAAKS